MATAKRSGKSGGTDPGYEALKRDLKAGSLASCYLFHGEEGYLRQAYLGQIRRRFLDGPAADFNYHRFSRETFSWDRVAEAVEATPLMAERSLVEVDDVDLYKEPEAARGKLIALLSDLPAHCCLIFHYDTIPFKADKRLKKLHEAIEAHVQLVEFRRPSDAELQTWVRRQALRGGKDIDRRTTDHLIFLTDGSLSALESELIKLTAYAAGELITKQDVDAVVEPTLNASSFDISNAIADGDYDRALGKLRQLLAMQEEPIRLLGAISSQLRRLLYAKVLQESGRGGGAAALAKLAGIAEYPARLSMEAARRLSRPFCERAVLLCLETDRRMKRSYDDPERLLELLLLRLAQEAKR